MDSWVEVFHGECKRERQNIAVPGTYQYKRAHVGQNWDGNHTEQSTNREID